MSDTNEKEMDCFIRSSFYLTYPESELEEDEGQLLIPWPKGSLIGHYLDSIDEVEINGVTIAREDLEISLDDEAVLIRGGAWKRVQAGPVQTPLQKLLVKYDRALDCESLAEALLIAGAIVEMVREK